MPIYRSKRHGTVYKARDPLSELEEDLCLWLLRGDRGRSVYFWSAVGLIWPGRVRHSWSDRRVDGLSDYNFLSWCGCGGSGKTDDAVMYSMLYWLADPTNTTVIYTSTTGKMLRKRMWPVLEKLFYEAKGVFPAKLVSSQILMRGQFGDRESEKSGIFGISVKEGNTAKASADIQGLHNKRMLVVVDEATDTPPAIFEVFANLRIGCSEFQVIAIGNPNSRFDEHGKFSEPKDGWASVSVDTDEWETVNQLDGRSGLCQRFDGYDSPRIHCPDRKDLGFLIGLADITTAEKKLGANDPRFWKYYRGFWAPDGCDRTVFSETLLIKHKCFDSVIWTGVGKQWVVGFLDPAFGGGDRAAMRFAKCGDIGGKVAMLLEPPSLLHINAASNEPVHYQLARQVKERCQARGCSPENFGLDATGEGGGLASIIKREWSGLIREVEFGGKPSDLPVSSEDRRKCDEAYDRRVTELWFSIKEFAMAGQLFGMDKETAVELTARRFDDHNRKLRVETKIEMKERLNRSPDLADCLAGLCEVARRTGLQIQGAPVAGNRRNPWLEAAKKAHEVFEVDDEEVTGILDEIT